LATIPAYATPRDRNRQRLRLMLAILIVAAVLGSYVMVYWLRQVQGG
jgi:hypothetical protein